jgi:hypothetical protein
MKRLWSVVLIALGSIQLGRYCVRFLGDLRERLDLEILLEAGERFRAGFSPYRLQDAAEHTKPPLLSPLFEAIGRLPPESVKFFWSAMTLLLPLAVALGWGRLRTLERDTRYFAAAFGSCLLISWSWRAEIELGQYNLLLLGMTLVSLTWVRKQHEMAAGALSLLAVLLKPTQIFFLPAIAAPLASSRKRALRFAAGAAIALASLSGWYLAFRSPDQLLSDHLEWLHFLPQSSAKHIGRWDNYSLPSFLHHSGIPWASSPILTLLGASFAVVIVARLRDRPSTSFHWCTWLSLALSPMNWRQNFVMLTPLAFDLIHASLATPEETSRNESWRARFGTLTLLAVFGVHLDWKMPGVFPLLISAVAILVVPSQKANLLAPGGKP